MYVLVEKKFDSHKLKKLAYFSSISLRNPLIRENNTESFVVVSLPLTRGTSKLSGFSINFNIFSSNCKHILFNTGIVSKLKYLIDVVAMSSFLHS